MVRYKLVIIFFLLLSFSYGCATIREIEKEVDNSTVNLEEDIENLVE